MPDDRISRRAAVGAGLAAGATALGAAAGLSPAAAALPVGPVRGLATAGPCGFWPGHTLSYQFFLPAVRGGLTQEVPFRLILKAVDGSVLLTYDFRLRPGAGMEVKVARMDD